MGFQLSVASAKNEDLEKKKGKKKKKAELPAKATEQFLHFHFLPALKWRRNSKSLARFSSLEQFFPRVGSVPAGFAQFSILGWSPRGLGFARFSIPGWSNWGSVLVMFSRFSILGWSHRVQVWYRWGFARFSSPGWSCRGLVPVMFARFSHPVRCHCGSVRQGLPHSPSRVGLTKCGFGTGGVFPVLHPSGWCQ